MTSPSKGIDSSESLSAGILRLESIGVINEYESKTGAPLADEVKISITYLVDEIVNPIITSGTLEALNSVIFLLSWHKLHSKEVTQPIIDALKRIRVSTSTTTPSDEVLTTVSDLLEHALGASK